MSMNKVTREDILRISGVNPADIGVLLVYLSSTQADDGTPDGAGDTAEGKTE